MRTTYRTARRTSWNVTPTAGGSASIRGWWDEGGPRLHDHPPQTRSEQPLLGGVEPTESVVVDDRAGDAAVGGEDSCLRLDLLGREDPADRSEQRVAVEQVQVAGELLDGVDLAPPLDLDRNGRPGGVAAHQVHRTDRGRILPAYERQPFGQRRGMLGE